MSPKRVAVIGAGIAGIASVKECLAVGLEVKCFEKLPWVAGIWHAYSDAEGTKVKTPMYKNCVCNLSSELFAFSDFPIPKNWPTFLPAKMVDEYLNMYVDNFSLRKHIYTSHPVTKVFQDHKTNVWHVRYKTPGAKEESEELFDWVLICSGRQSKSRMPYFKGQDTFEGEILHFENYWEPTKYADKRVVIVGPGASGCDAAIDISHHAAKTYLVQHTGRDYLTAMNPSTHRPADRDITRMLFDILPKSFRLYMFENFILLRPRWLIRSDVRFGDKPVTITTTTLFERLSTGVIEAIPSIESLSGREIRLTDGRVLSEIDTIICGTGYEVALDHILEDPSIYCHWPRGLENVRKGDGSIVNIKTPSLVEKEWLWKGILPPDMEGIAFVGFSEVMYSATCLSEMQARYIAALITSQTLHPLPPAPKMHADIQAHYLTLNKYLQPAYFYDETISYMDWFAEEAAGARPSFWRIFRKFGFGLAMKVIMGPLFPQQWRLIGRGKWHNAERMLIEQS